LDCRGRESFKLLKRHAFFSSSSQFSFAVKGPSFADSIEHANMRRRVVR
jgi:hypothetical protein